MLKAMTPKTLMLALSLTCAAASAAAGPGGPGPWHHPGARPPHPGVVPPFFRFHYPPFPVHPFAWGGPWVWHPPMYWWGPPWPTYPPPRSSGTRARCYHYFGQRYCVGGEDEAPRNGDAGQRSDIGTGPRLFDGD